MEIFVEFKSFYSSLYTMTELSPERITHFLESTAFVKYLMNEHRTLLDTPITSLELENAIKSLKIRTPGKMDCCQDFINLLRNFYLILYYKLATTF